MIEMIKVKDRLSPLAPHRAQLLFFSSILRKVKYNMYDVCFLINVSFFKLVCFSDFCLIINPHGPYTKKFIEQDLSSSFDTAESYNQSFAMVILEKAVDSVCSKYEKRLALMKLPVEKLMEQIERRPDIIELKKLFAVKKSIILFQQTVENITKILKVLGKYLNSLYCRGEEVGLF